MHRGRLPPTSFSAAAAGEPPSSLSTVSIKAREKDLARTISSLINGTIPSSSILDSAIPLHLLPSLTPAVLLLSLDLLRPPSLSLHLLRFSLTRLNLAAGDLRAILSKTFSVLLRSRDLSAAENFLLHSPEALPLRRSGDAAFNALIRAHARGGALRAAVDVFRSMRSLGASPSTHSYNSLISALLRRGRTDAAAELFDEMSRSAAAASRPDTCTFNTLIRGFCLNSMVGKGILCFQEMSRSPCRPDLITYNTLLDGLCRAGEVERACNLFNEMRAKGPSLAPNVVSYTTLIRGYCKKLRVEEAMELLDEMVGSGVKPNRITFNTLFRGICDAGRMDLLRTMLERVSDGGNEMGFRPDTCTFNTILASHCKSGSVDDALKVFDAMPALKVKPDSATYSTLIRCLCTNGDFGRAENIVDGLLEKGLLAERGGSPLIMAAYNPILKHLCDNGKAEKARVLFHQFLKKNAASDVVAFKTMISGYCKEGEFRKGYELLINMKRKDVVPDSETFDALISGFLGKGNVGFAWKALQRMLESGHRPGTSTYHSVLAGLLKKVGHAREAGYLLAAMLERKVRPNIDLSTGVITSMFGDGLKDRASEIAGLLYNNGYFVRLEKIVGFLCQRQKFLDARDVLLFGFKKKQRMDLEQCAEVITGLCGGGMLSDAFEFFQTVNDEGFTSEVSSALNDLIAALEGHGNWKEAEFIKKQLNRSSLPK